MTDLLAIDPGKLSLGWARFKDDALRSCGFVSSRSLLELAEELDNRFGTDHRAVVEVPQVYQQRRWKGDPNDLIDVAVAAGVAVGAIRLCDDVRLVRPCDWKGSRPKKIDNALTLSRLNDTERRIIEGCDVPRGKIHNIVDAVGIGLWALGRR